MMMGLSGVYRENECLVSTEQFDDPWYEGRGGRNADARRGERKNQGMESGVSASYDKLEREVLAA
jgi:hypothetical protein